MFAFLQNAYTTFSTIWVPSCSMLMLFLRDAMWNTRNRQIGWAWALSLVDGLVSLWRWPKSLNAATNWQLVLPSCQGTPFTGQFYSGTIDVAFLCIAIQVLTYHSSQNYLCWLSLMILLSTIFCSTAFLSGNSNVSWKQLYIMLWHSQKFVLCRNKIAK